MSEADPAQRWWIVVLETVSVGDGKRWGVGHETEVAGTFDQVVLAAEKLAWEHRPQHPMSPRSRRVYRVDERTWLVVVEGRLVIEPFEIRIVTPVDPPPEIAPG